MDFTDVVVFLLNVVGGDYQRGLATDQLGQTLAEYNAPAFAAAATIADTVVRPVASVILALMLVVELARNASKVEGDGQTGVKLIAGTMFRFVLLIVAVQYSGEILTAINEVAQSIITGASDAYPTPDSGTEDQTSLGESLRQQIKDAGIETQITLFIELLIPFLVTGAAFALVHAMIIFRFLEMYLLSAFAPLPMAFAGHPDTKQISIGYLRAYGAAALHGATLVIGIFLYGQIIQGATVSPDAVISGEKTMDNWIMESQPVLWGGGILLIMIILGSNRLAKSIVGN